MSTVRAAAAAAGNTPVVEHGARLGYAAGGLLHLLLAWVTVQMAWTSYGGEADQSGALGTLAGSAVGSILLWATAAGFALLAVWQVIEAIARRDLGTWLKSAGKAAVYVALAWTAASVVQGSGGSSDTSGMTASLMAKPYGRALLAAVGLTVLGIAVYHVVKGWRASFLADLREHPGTWTVTTGRIGYVAKGVALALVGAFLVGAGATGESERAKDLDGALRSVLEAPLGKVLLTLVAIGFAAYGLYSFARARYARV
ncbi:DUF1206 domain-containing protein [Cellulomonas sp. KRMCY2]|uniref:DUF1206 domain-containing protein n=1 Tax=Cellulomonas sp. KRMCY2 TaxID=1304865 RepID=UPI0004A225A8|nr:DUF1206 domain-containing protein [Cellulomonas sp. KRMCY2]